MNVDAGVDAGLEYLTADELDELDGLLLDVSELSLLSYLELAWGVIEPGTRFVSGWHIEAICDHLEAVTWGEIQNLLITISPRSTKSICTSIAYPTWAWTRRPEIKFLFSSYSASLSSEHAVKSRWIIDSPWYRERWGDLFDLTTDQNVKSHYENTRRGYRISTSTGGTALGRGGDILVCDDPHNLKNIHSETVRGEEVRWFNEVWATRVNDQKTGRRIVIAQRGHQDDIPGHCIDQGYEHLNIPNEYTGKGFSTSLGWRDPRTEVGQLMCSDRLGERETALLKRQMGSYAYAAQFQQDPAPAEGGIFQRGWWRFWTELPDEFDLLISSWDMTYKGHDDTDFVAGQVWGLKYPDKYLLDQVRAHLSFTESLQAVRKLKARWPGMAAILIEDAANGPAIIDTLQREIPGVLAIPAVGSKVARAHAVSPEVEAGNVWIPDPDTVLWVDAYLEELTAFDNADHDDQVDATTQAIYWLNQHAEQDELDIL